MGGFIIHFLICNIFISVIIGMLLAAKHLLHKILTSRMQYNVWFLLLGLLAVPFLPVGQLGNLPVLSWLRDTPASFHASSAETTAAVHQAGRTDWMNDFSITIRRNTPSSVGFLLWVFMDCRNSRHDPVFLKFSRSLPCPEEIRPASAKSRAAQAVSSLPGGNEHYGKHPHLQHGVFEIPRDCRTVPSMHFPSDSPGLRLQRKGFAVYAAS